MRFLIIISILLPFSSFGQSASFKEIKLKVTKANYNIPDSTISFPVVITKNKLVSNRINNMIRNEVIEEYDNKKSLWKNLRYYIDEMLVINLSYDVTLNNKILSLSIFKEGCGAYCSSGRTYFNFDITTGRRIFINSIISPGKVDSFKQIVKADKIKFLQEYKKEQDMQFKNVADSSTYDWIIAAVNDCMSFVSLDQFSLSPGVLEIFEPCEFPHAVRSQQPFYELKYPYKQISRFLKPGIKLH